jgi:hypothetical protein
MMYVPYKYKRRGLLHYHTIATILPYNRHRSTLYYLHSLHKTLNKSF